MMVGLGVYLPFYMSFTAFLGSVAKLVYDKVRDARDAKAGITADEKEKRDVAYNERGLVVASGLLGGESIVGVIIAFISVAMGLIG